MNENIDKLSELLIKNIFNTIEEKKREFFSVKMAIFLLGVKEIFKEEKLIKALEKVDTYEKFIGINIESNSELTKSLNSFQNQVPDYLNTVLFSYINKVKEELESNKDFFEY